MLKYHKIFSIALGLLFMVVLVVFSNPTPVFRFILPAFLAVLLLTFLYNRWYLQALNKYNIWLIIRPLLLETSGFIMYLLLLNSFFRGGFLVATVFFIAVFEIMLANFSENLLLNETLLTAFAFCFSFFGFSWWVPGFLYLYFFGLFLALLLLSRSFFDYTAQTSGIKWLNAFIASFLSVQIFWASSFLPFHYSVLAILLLNYFYVLVVLDYHSLYNTLSPKKVKFYFSLAGICLLFAFSATPWTIVG
ncbi:MAG: hypothetical protein HYZ51_00145 [Candidatus Doudnabacteria bacterium]|nr:hypothetical protein [Candidatus Doudnabacteria bacterium]